MGQIKDNVFYTQFSKHNRFFMPECNKFDDEYELHNINGVDELVKTGNLKPNYDLIQSYKDECDINLTIQKISNGDPVALENYKKQKALAAYADISDLSDDILENFYKVQKFKLAFDNLPSDIKAKYDNNYRKFISSLGDVKNEFNNSSSISNISDIANDNSSVSVDNNNKGVDE